MAKQVPDSRTDGAPSRISDRWFQESFGDDYLRIYRHRSSPQAVEEARFAKESLGLGPSDLALDLGCGGGRHLRALLDQGVPTVGLDLSAPLLQHARESQLRHAGECDSPRTDRQLRLLRADMRFLPFGPSFTAVLSFFTSFGYFFDEAENRRVLRGIARVLRPGGRLLLDLMDRDSVARGLVPESRRREADFEVHDRRWISEDGLRVEKETVMTGPGGTRRFQESVRLYSLSQVEEALASLGVRVEQVVGDFSGREYRPGATPRMIFLARKETEAGAP